MVVHMRNLLLSSIFSIVLLTTTGCTSNSISDSLALIEQEHNQGSGRQINKEVLLNIQALRASQKAAVNTYTFVYSIHNKELSYSDKITIAKLLVKNHHVIINIAPAKGTDKLTQLTLSMERAKVLHQYIDHFNKTITINFSPELSIDTINLVIGA